jgi:hypothetical protein
VSSRQVFSCATVNLVKKYVLDKFPPLPSRKRSYEYNIIRDRGYLKANESEEASANDPESCVKGILFMFEAICMCDILII